MGTKKNSKKIVTIVLAIIIIAVVGLLLFKLNTTKELSWQKVAQVSSSQKSSTNKVEEEEELSEKEKLLNKSLKYLERPNVSADKDLSDQFVALFKGNEKNLLELGLEEYYGEEAEGNVNGYNYQDVATVVGADPLFVSNWYDLLKNDYKIDDSLTLVNKSNEDNVVQFRVVYVKKDVDQPIIMVGNFVPNVDVIQLVEMF